MEREDENENSLESAKKPKCEKCGCESKEKEKVMIPFPEGAVWICRECFLKYL